LRQDSESSTTRIRFIILRTLFTRTVYLKRWVGAVPFSLYIAPREPVAERSHQYSRACSVGVKGTVEIQIKADGRNQHPCSCATWVELERFNLPSKLYPRKWIAFLAVPCLDLARAALRAGCRQNHRPASTLEEPSHLDGNGV
jgi:hypothetical protein